VIRRRSACAIALLAATLSPGPAAAQSHPGFDCNLFGPRHPCDPYLLYPPGQDLRLTLRLRDRSSPTEPGPEPAEKPAIDNIRALSAALDACWLADPLEPMRPGMEITVRFSLNRAGTLIGEPRLTYTTRGISAAERDHYYRLIVEGLRRCTPLRFTAGMAGAIAGRPITIRFIETRGTRKAGAGHG
jgi:hypothetical protein